MENAESADADVPVKGFKTFKLVFVDAMETYRGVKVWLHSFSTTELEGGAW
jgi:hypothetical protein